MNNNNNKTYRAPDGRIIFSPYKPAWTKRHQVQAWIITAILSLILTCLCIGMLLLFRAALS
jgi:hypothetical protein